MDPWKDQQNAVENYIYYSLAIREEYENFDNEKYRTFLKKY